MLEGCATTVAQATLRSLTLLLRFVEARPADEIARRVQLFLETGNGDNPPIALEKFAVFYPATRVLFKAKGDAELLLCYGNPRVSSPSYDLNLAAGQLLAAD